MIGPQQGKFWCEGSVIRRKKKKSFHLPTVFVHHLHCCRLWCRKVEFIRELHTIAQAIFPPRGKLV